MFEGLFFRRVLEIQEDLQRQEDLENAWREYDALIEERQRRELEEEAEDALSLDRYFEECEERYQEELRLAEEAEAAEEESAAAFANLLFWGE